ncbi:hypothetical protein EYR40_001763 [Pleurotus pulmonarius]|nr:hypothetical protein EYR40_001763 [Pleurotus pulmonarius]
MSTSEDDPLTSLRISPAALADYEEIKPRPPHKGPPFALIKTNEHPDLPLRIHNYTDKATRCHISDPLLQASRALITERTTGNVVSRSFSKFFNFHERPAYKPTGDEFTAVVEEKVDGSIISMFWYAGQWRTASKAQFSGPHVSAAEEVLRDLYPGATNLFDKEKAYVFELVYPRMPLAIKYTENKLVLLSIIGKDGSEPPWDFDWSIFPFPRPRVQRVEHGTTLNMKELKALNIANEEGFVVKYYRTKDDRRPQRIKVKFEAYLAICSFDRYSPRLIVDDYIRARTAISSLDWANVVKPKLEAVRLANVESRVAVADDFGGEAWLAALAAIDARVYTLFEEKEYELLQAKETLRKAGYDIPGPRSGKERADFVVKIKQNADPTVRKALFAWDAGAGDKKVIESFLKAVVLPEDLKSGEAVRIAETAP